MLDTRKKFRADAQYSTEMQASNVRTKRNDTLKRTLEKHGLVASSRSLR